MADIKSKITPLCKQLEKERKIKILFCIESGSRVWRIASPDSDYDVRFVYCWPIEKYIAVSKPREIIERKVQTAPQIDAVGFDIFKYTKLLADSNPTAIEWQLSDIVYYGKKPAGLQKFTQKHFNPIKLYYHYRSLAKKNYTKYIATNKDVTCKRYLYIMRGVINAQFAQIDKLPPINFQQAVDDAKISKRLKSKLLELIKIKRAGAEKQKISRIKLFDDYIKAFLAKEAPPKPRKISKAARELLDKELRKIILK